jgi:hypothetical protein
MSIFDIFSPKKRKYQAALTVVLAEHTVATLKPDQKAKVDVAVEKFARSMGISPLQIYAAPRHYRAGLEAAALKELGIAPAVPGEEWTTIGNPFAYAADEDLGDEIYEALKYLRGKGIEV